MSDPRVQYLSGALDAIKAAGQCELGVEQPEWWGNLVLAQVYATLAAVPVEVLVGLELDALESHYRNRDLQEKLQKDVADKLGADVAG